MVTTNRMARHPFATILILTTIDMLGCHFTTDESELQPRNIIFLQNHQNRSKPLKWNLNIAPKDDGKHHRSFIWTKSFQTNYAALFASIDSGIGNVVTSLEIHVQEAVDRECCYILMFSCRWVKWFEHRMNGKLQFAIQWNVNICSNDIRAQ